MIIINNSASVISNAWVLRGWTCFRFIKIWKPVWNRKNHFYSILKRHRTYQRWLWLKLLVQQVIIEIFLHSSIGNVNEMIIPIQFKICGPLIRFKKWRILHLLLEIYTHQNKKWLLLFEWVHCCGKNFHDRLKWLLKFNTFESSVYFFFIWNFLWVEWKSYISEGLIVQTCIFRGEIVFSQINKSVIPRDFLKYQFETWQSIAGLEKLHLFFPVHKYVSRHIVYAAISCMLTFYTHSLWVIVVFMNAHKLHLTLNIFVHLYLLIFMKCYIVFLPISK